MRSHDLTKQVDLQSFLTMTNSDLEEVGITDAEEKLSILDAIYEIKVLIWFLKTIMYLISSFQFDN